MAALPFSDLHLADRTFRAVLETIPDAVVLVDDSGRIAASNEVCERIFDPGFTTRGVRVGSGLGLAIAKQALDEHGGSIAMDSHVGEGTTVTLRIPLRS